MTKSTADKTFLEAKTRSERQASHAAEVKDLQILRWKSPSEKGVMSCLGKAMPEVQWKQSFCYDCKKGQTCGVHRLSEQPELDSDES